MLTGFFITTILIIGAVAIIAVKSLGKMLVAVSLEHKARSEELKNAMEGWTECIRANIAGLEREHALAEQLRRANIELKKGTR